MTLEDIVEKAIPGANAELIEHILWGRTPWPLKQISPRELWKAAHRYRRAVEHRILLCDLCDNKARPDDWLCAHCERMLHPQHSDDK